MGFTFSGGSKEKKHPALVLGEIGLVSSLGGYNIPLFVGSEKRDSIAIHSRYAKQNFIFSSYDSSKFIDELCELGRYFRHKPVIFSDDDRALLNISQHRERLKKHYLFLYPEEQTVSSLLDKQRFIELSEEYNLPAPASHQVRSYRQFTAIASEVQFPCIIKPTQRHYWWGDEFIETVGFYRKAIKCSNRNELEQLYQKISKVNPSVVIQEYVCGGDDSHYSANLLVDKQGELQGHYIAQKKRIYPIKAGTGTYVETLDNEEVLDASLQVIHKLGLNGLVNVQFKQDSRSGEYRLLEVHIRNSLWSRLGAQAGANLAHMYYEYLVEGRKNEQPVKGRSEVKYVNLSDDIRALRAYQAEGKLTYREWWDSLKGDRVFAVCSSKDIVPVLLKIWYFIVSRVKPHKRTLPESESGFWARPVNFMTKLF